MKDLQRGYQGQSPGGLSRAVLDSIANLSHQVDQLDTKVDLKFDQLSDLFIPRREMTETISGMKERTADHHSRLTALEEWRCAQTKQAATEQLATQQQMTDSSAVQGTKREEYNKLVLMLLVNALVSLVVFTLGYIATHH